MAILEIIQKGDAVLRAKAEPITNVKDGELQQLIDDMIETMRDANGVGLAAPQIGRELSLAVIETMAEIDEEGEDIPGSRQLYVIMDPEITWASTKTLSGIEGCLSIVGYLGEVDRHFAIVVSYLDRNGKKKRKRFRGWDARIFQHEIDHLNEILYTDILTSEDNYWSEEEYELYKNTPEATENE